MAWEDIDVAGSVQEYREHKEIRGFVDARDWAYQVRLPVKLTNLIDETPAPLEDLNSYFVTVFLYINVSANGVPKVHAHPHSGAILKYAVERICNTFALTIPTGSREYSADLDYALTLVLASLFSVYPLDELQGGLSVLESLSTKIGMSKPRLAELKAKFNISANGSAQFATIVRICALNFRLRWVKAFPEVLDSSATVAAWVQEILTVLKFQGVLPYEECVTILECYFRQTGDFLFHSENVQTSQKYPPGVYYLQHDPPCLWNVKEPDFDALLRDQFGLPELNGRHKTARAAFVDRIRGQYEMYSTVDFHRISHYKDNAFYMDAGQNRVIKIEADRVSVIQNGSEGTYFLPEVAAWSYVHEHKRKVNGLNLLTERFAELRFRKN